MWQVQIQLFLAAYGGWLRRFRLLVVMAKSLMPTHLAVCSA
jgi:hypothetical protein